MNESQLITVPALIGAAGAITYQLEKAGVPESYSGILALVADIVLCVVYGAAKGDNLAMAALLGAVSGASSLGASVANVRTVSAAKTAVAKVKAVKVQSPVA